MSNIKDLVECTYQYTDKRQVLMEARAEAEPSVSSVNQKGAGSREQGRCRSSRFWGRNTAEL
jgi:hypothetical protein